jgi:hypothetical protein
MTAKNITPPVNYFDEYELAEALSLSVATIRVRARWRPWLLPQRALLYDHNLLRWRQDVVATWLLGRI